jgi:acetylornithine deacetylase/succinyl-diaminopimelate desuccinylase-like protein
VIHGGQKTNMIPDTVELEVDIRTLPGTTGDDVDAHLRTALGDLADQVEIGAIFNEEPTRSPTDNRLWDVLRSRVQMAYPGAELSPGMILGGTDGRFFRRRGTVAYGAGLFAPSITLETFGNRFHGNDERIDVESLALTTELWLGVARELLS